MVRCLWLCYDTLLKDIKKALFSEELSMRGREVWVIGLFRFSFISNTMEYGEDLSSIADSRGLRTRKKIKGSAFNMRGK